MRQRSGVRFPILSIKRIDRDIQIHPIIDAAIGDREPVLIGPRHVERLYTAGLAKPVFRPASIECVLCHRGLALQQAKARRGHDDMNIAAHRANGAIAILGLKCGRQVDLKSHGPAMTAALMCNEIRHDHLLTFLPIGYAIT